MMLMNVGMSRKQRLICILY